MKTTDFIEKRNRNRIQCGIWKFEKYHVCRTDSGYLYAVGTDSRFDGRLLEHVTPDMKFNIELTDGITEEIMSYRASDGGTWSTITLDNTSLLLSLLSLSEQLDHPYSYDNMQPTYENNCTQKDIDAILLWCEKYGLPMETPILWNKYRKIGFQVNLFHYALSELYTAFLIYRRVIFNDISESNRFRTIDLAECKKDLSGMLNRDNYIRMKIDLFSDHPKIKYSVKDQIAAAYAQILFLITDTSGCGVDICENCGTPYPKKIATSKYCKFCHNTRYQITRDRQRKEKAQNEQAGQR